MTRRRATEGDTLPNALAALARTRERALVEIDENVAARRDETEAETETAARSRVKVSRDDES